MNASCSKVLLFLTVLAATGCGKDCWFDLAVAESTRGLFVVRDCDPKRHDLIRYDLDDLPSYARIEHVAYSRIALGANEDWAAVSVATGHHLDLLDVHPPKYIRSTNGLPGTIGKLAPAPDGESIWVAVWGAQSAVALFDTRDGDVRAFVPVPGDPVAIAFLSDENAVVAASSGEGVVTKIDAVHFDAIATATTSGTLDFALLASPPRIALLEDRSQRISIRDLSTLKMIKALSTGADPRRIAASADGRTFAVSERGTLAIRVFDGSTLEQRAVIELDSEPDAVALTNDGRVFVGLGHEDQIAVVDLARGEVTERIEF